jgi:hypothetical protein
MAANFMAAQDHRHHLPARDLEEVAGQPAPRLHVLGGTRRVRAQLAPRVAQEAVVDAD